MRIGGYECQTPLATAGSGGARWCVAVKDGRRYFLKQFLSPVQPLPGAALSPALREKRMVFSQETADDKNRIQALDFRKLEAEPRDTLEFGVGGKITPARTEIDISRTDPGHQLLEQIQLFKR